MVRTQTLEEDLAGERASKRLLATRMLQEKQAVQDQLARLEEEHKGLQELWKHTNEEKDKVQTKAAIGPYIPSAKERQVPVYILRVGCCTSS